MRIPSSQASSPSSAAADSGSVPIEISVTVDGKKTHASGLGECHHTTDASIAVLASSGRHDIATVKGGPLKGSGSASVQPAGAAGTPSVTGKDDSGNQLLVSVSCARFTEPVAEGG